MYVVVVFDATAPTSTGGYRGIAGEGILFPAQQTYRVRGG